MALNGLALEEEVALIICYSLWHASDNDLSRYSQFKKEFLTLEDTGLITLASDINFDHIYLKSVSSLEMDHYRKARQDRRQFRAVSDDADMLMMLLAVEDNPKML